MTEENWKPHFRASTSTLTKVLHCPAFSHSRERAAAIAENPDKLRALADSVESLDYLNPPLAVVADRVGAAARFLRARAKELEATTSANHGGSRALEVLTEHSASAGVATRERLLVASLDYLVTTVDLVPDFRPGGYIDDVVLLAWVFGVAASELAPYVTDDPGTVRPDSAEA
jgi:hypothetical protein